MFRSPEERMSCLLMGPKADSSFNVAHLVKGMEIMSLPSQVQGATEEEKQDGGFIQLSNGSYILPMKTFELNLDNNQADCTADASPDKVAAVKKSSIFDIE